MSTMRPSSGTLDDLEALLSDLTSGGKPRPGYKGRVAAIRLELAKRRQAAEQNPAPPEGSP